MACFDSSPGKMRRTAVWISREEIVDFFEYEESSASSCEYIYQDTELVMRTGGLRRNTLEDVVNEGVQDGHCLVRDTRVRVDLLEDYSLRENLAICKV